MNKDAHGNKVIVTLNKETKMAKWVDALATKLSDPFDHYHLVISPRDEIGYADLTVMLFKTQGLGQRMIGKKTFIVEFDYEHTSKTGKWKRFKWLRKQLWKKNQ